MKKIPITIWVPALSGTYDFLVPDTLAAQEVQQLAARLLDAEFRLPEERAPTLFDLSDGRALRPECSFAQLGSSAGAKLALF